MVATFLIPGQGVVLDGHAASRASCREAARLFLISDCSYSEDQADLSTDSAEVSRAWWGGDSVGFVNQEYEGSAAVSVVNLRLVDLAS